MLLSGIVCSWQRNIDGEAVAVDTVVICNRVVQLANGDDDGDGNGNATRRMTTAFGTTTGRFVWLFVFLDCLVLLYHLT